ncbi:unnamed protein product [Amoebophrya sp. A120]|nr:unnamed protein product [Amoebophrya sp. A120]|eukprot:GSA120T00013668001.1
MLGLRPNIAKLPERGNSCAAETARKTTGSLYYDFADRKARTLSSGQELAAAAGATSSTSTKTTRFKSAAAKPISSNPQQFPIAALSASRLAKEELDDGPILVACQKPVAVLKAQEGLRKKRLGEKILPETVRAETYVRLHSMLFPAPPASEDEPASKMPQLETLKHQLNAVAEANQLGTKESLLPPELLNEIEQILHERWTHDVRQVLSEIDSCGTQLENSRVSKIAELQRLVDCCSLVGVGKGAKGSVEASCRLKTDDQLRTEAECVLETLKLDQLWFKTTETLAKSAERGQQGGEGFRAEQGEEEFPPAPEAVDGGAGSAEAMTVENEGDGGDNAVGQPADGEEVGLTEDAAVLASADTTTLEKMPAQPFGDANDLKTLITAMETAYKYRDSATYLCAQIQQRALEVSRMLSDLKNTHVWVTSSGVVMPEDELEDLQLQLDQQGWSVLSYHALNEHALDPVLSPNLCSHGATAFAKINPSILLQILEEHSQELQMYRNLFYHSLKALKDNFADPSNAAFREKLNSDEVLRLKTLLEDFILTGGNPGQVLHNIDGTILLSCAEVLHSYKCRSCITNFFFKENRHYKFNFSC